MTHLEDREIIGLFHERSEQAILELDRKYGAAVRRTAVNILNNRQDAEECANDTWLGAWRTIPPQNPDPLSTYVCRIARDLAIKKLHANTAAKRNGNYDLALDELEACIPSGTDLEADLERKELSAAINRFLGTLGYEDRYLFVRRYWYADSVADIAAQTHGSVNRTSVRLFRLREKLRKSLQKEGLNL